jgi:hypothetical protein
MTLAIVFSFVVDAGTIPALKYMSGRAMSSKETRMDQSEYDRLVEQYLTEIQQFGGPEIAQASRRAIENKDLEGLKRITKELAEQAQRSREMLVEVYKLKQDTQNLYDAVQRSRKG